MQYNNIKRNNKLHMKKVRRYTKPNIGKYETQILDEIARQIGYKILRQYRVLGYWLDGYILELNLAVEIDERPKIKEKDIGREKLIKQELNCKFLRIPTYKESKEK